MITISSAIAFASAVFIITAKPGPGMLAVISRSLSSGWIQGSLLGLGICLIHIFYLAVAGVAFNIASELMDFMVILLKTLGAVVMIYSGVQEYLKIDTPLIMPKKKVMKEEGLKNFLSGVMICLSNPIVILFYAAFVPTIMDIQTLGIRDLLICSGLLLISNWGLLVVISLAADSVRVYLADEKNARRLRILVSLMFIMIGLIIGMSAMPFIDWGDLYLQN